MRLGIVTLFPELFGDFLRTSLVGRAVSKGLLHVHLEDLRAHGIGKHHSVDDTPYGGGAGMVLRVDCIAAALDAAGQRLASDGAGDSAPRRVLLTPQGAPFKQATAERWAKQPGLVLVCGRYEGFDERVRGLVDEEVSLGDFVMIGGEVGAMAIVESCARLLPGVLGNADSATEESFGSAQGGGLEYPHYTRPAVFRDQPVPAVLSGGNHAEIARWRTAQASVRTAERRPDLLASTEALQRQTENEERKK